MGYKNIFLLIVTFVLQTSCMELDQPKQIPSKLFPQIIHCFGDDLKSKINVTRATSKLYKELGNNFPVLLTHSPNYDDYTNYLISLSRYSPEKVGKFLEYEKKSPGQRIPSYMANNHRRLGMLKLSQDLQTSCMKLDQPKQIPSKLFPKIIHYLGDDLKSKINVTRATSKLYKELGNNFPILLTHSPDYDDYTNYLISLSRYSPEKVVKFLEYEKKSPGQRTPWCITNDQRRLDILELSQELNILSNEDTQAVAVKDFNQTQNSITVYKQTHNNKKKSLDFNKQIIDLYVKQGISVEKKDKKGNTILHYAIHCVRNEKDFALVKRICSAKSLQSPAEICNNNGDSPIHLFMQWYHFDPIAEKALRYLLDTIKHSSTLLNSTNKQGETFLHSCVKAKSSSLTPILLSYKNINPNVRDAKGWTAADYAIDYEREMSTYRKKINLQFFMANLKDNKDLECIYHSPQLSYWEQSKIFFALNGWNQNY